MRTGGSLRGAAFYLLSALPTHTPTPLPRIYNYEIFNKLTTNHRALRTEDLAEHRLLTPQAEFIYAPESLSSFSGGYGVGKSWAGCLKSLLLSQIFPGNEGMVGRYIGRDLEDTTIPLFFEVMPPSWIAKNGYNKQKNMVTLRNGSKIYFRHIHDANAKTASKSRRVGANLGWFFVDQMEELSREHHGGLVGRLRHPKAGKKFGFGTANPNGRDWIQQMFFPKLPAIVKGQLWGAQRNGNLLGIAADSEVNRISKGGFVDDDYYDRMLSEFPADWIERYIHCSFDDFSGKIFKGYTPTSIHNVRPFPIPHHWNYVVGIDVGGNCPWAIVPAAVDDRGTLVITPGYHESGSEAKIANVVRWIKENLPWDSGRCKFVIDPENKPVMIELQEYGIHCVPADKKVLPGVHRMMGYFNVAAINHLPQWYLDTQPEERVAKFANAGAPRVFVFENATTIRKELDEWIWDAKKPNTPLKTGEKRFDVCDSLRYVMMARPQASELAPIEDKHAALRKVDPMSAREWESLERRRAEYGQRKDGNYVLREAMCDEVGGSGLWVPNSSTQEWEW